MRGIELVYLNSVLLEYKNYRFPPPTDLGHVYGDFVFVIDQTQTMGAIDFATASFRFRITISFSLALSSGYNS